MLQLIAIGVGAGVATALLFASIKSGVLLSIFLVTIAPLPIMIVSLGWGSLAGLIGAITATSGLALALDPLYVFSFVLMVGPAWWLCRLALLARPAEASLGPALTAPAPADLEWYPVGRLMLWAALLTGAVVVAPMLFSLIAGDSFDAAIRKKFELLLRLRANLPKDGPLVIPGINNPDLLLDIMVAVMPLLTAVLTTGTHTLNLWLAGRIVAVSGRLRRPWPDLPGLILPKWSPLMLTGAIAMSFLPGFLGTAAMVMTASLLTAFAILGLAVIHSVTRGRDGRFFVLAVVYGALVLITGTVIPLALFGLAEAAFHIRARFAQSRHGPPAKPT